MTDYVSVRDLSVPAVIGVHDWERAIEQTLIVSVDMVPTTADVRQAAATDDLADALDYSAVATTIVAVVREGKFQLIETAAERVAERLLAEHPVTWLRLEVRKPIADGYTAAVTIERSRGHPMIAKDLVRRDRILHDREGFRVRRPCMPPSTARAVPVVAAACGLAR